MKNHPPFETALNDPLPNNYYEQLVSLGIPKQVAKKMTSKEARKNWLTYSRFRVGTCHGGWKATPNAYQILFIENSEPGNGDLDSVLYWFERSCARDKMDLVFLEVWNKKFLKHLETKRGFERIGECYLKKSYRNM